MEQAGNRVAIVGGVRTPFVKAGTNFKDLSMQQLGAHVLVELVKQYDLKRQNIDEVVLGTVILDPRTPNWAREILFMAGLPKTISAHSVSNNCISGLVAATFVAERIASGRLDTAIAGGSESMSKPTLIYNPKGADIFLQLSRARTTSEKLKLMLSLHKLKYFLPKAPSVKEPSTGLTMGEHAEISAKEFKIARADQDKIAFASHQNAATAFEKGVFKNEIAPLLGVDRDLIVRKDSTIEKLAKLKPVFDRSEAGTLTAGNSSPLTDGASAILLMSEKEAKKQGRDVIAYIRDYEYAAIDPNEGLLMAPAVAVPRLLKRRGLILPDFDLIEIHEAFAAQVLANISAWASGWKEQGIGQVDFAKLNVNGGSIAIGHPFAATGARIIFNLAAELKRRNLKRGLISICAAGAMAGAMIIERD
jgi:acetyl-CoA acetyltransferase family protein